MVQIETDRLFIREWEERYFAAFAAMNADPEVMEYFPSTLTDEQSRGVMERLMAKTQEFGFHFQPVVERASDRFVGFAGLARVEFAIHFAPAVEIAWRLCRDSWGMGYATEAAAAFVDYGFRSLDLNEIVSFAVEGNLRSRAVMTRIGMTQDVDGTFMHPNLDRDHALARHVLYRLPRTEAKAQNDP